LPRQQTPTQYLALIYVAFKFLKGGTSELIQNGVYTLWGPSDSVVGAEWLAITPAASRAASNFPGLV
jgi:hypothetical protein